LFDIDAALRYVVKKEGSNLHVKVDSHADGLGQGGVNGGGVQATIPSWLAKVISVALATERQACHLG